MIEFMPPISVLEYFFPKGRNASFLYNVRLTLRGRDSIFLAARHFNLAEGSLVLLPAYLCDTIPAAFPGGINFAYYDIRSDFSIDEGEIERLFQKLSPKVFYIIHYFGFLHTNLKELAALCKKYDVLFWEDHAHSALSDFTYEYSDAAIFSLRKLLPIPDGGGLYLRNSAPGEFLPEKSIKADLTALIILLKRKMWGISGKFRRFLDEQAKDNVYRMSQGENLSPKPISGFSRRTVRSLNLKEIVSKRRAVFQQYSRLAGGCKMEPVFTNLPAGICPQGFPVLVPNSADLMRRMEKHRIFLKKHWPLPAAMEETAPVSWKISQSIVTLPIYSQLSSENVERIARLTEKYS
jgi:dTDP-4-amino-4,6-dideoxygalactose transaminase